MPFSIAVLTCVGMFFSMIYTSFGLAAFPISLMKNMPPKMKHVFTKDVQMQINEISQDLDLLQTKYRGMNEWKTKDRWMRKKLEKDKKFVIYYYLKYNTFYTHMKQEFSEKNGDQQQ